MYVPLLTSDTLPAYALAQHLSNGGDANVQRAEVVDGKFVIIKHLRVPHEKESTFFALY